tara:strand:- start:3104 stop:3304 length:201 start_codon:yes stop_codon:yes gene_type:complete
LNYGICHLSITPTKNENRHQSELVSQLLYGECFKIISSKKNWIQILTIQDEYSGWVEKKEFKNIPQ